MTDALTLERQPGLDEGRLAALRAARAVALGRHHRSPVTLELDDEEVHTSLTLRFETPGPRSVAAWADREQTTEWAAEAIALEVVYVRRGLAAVGRAARGTRFDWYVGPPGTELEDAVALEVGGTDLRRPEVVLAEKLRQLRKRAAGRPGLAVAVQMSTPRAMLRQA